MGRITHPEGGRSMTKQSDALETDVNAIIKRHIAHRLPLPPPGTRARYGDFTGASSYHDAVNRITQAEQSFERLPAHIRRACNNDPGEFLDLVHDPARVDELVHLGLVPEQKPETVPEEETAPEPAPEP